MEALLKRSYNLREKTKYADLEIRVDGVSFHVHRVIVCDRSEVLAKECEGGFRVSFFKRSLSSVLTLTFGRSRMNASLSIQSSMLQRWNACCSSSITAITT